MIRDPLPVNSVAAGWALGMFIGCAIPFGMQLIISVPLAIRFRLSKVGATVGTLITNPITIFFIYPAQTWLASRLLGIPLSWSSIEKDCSQLGDISLWHLESWKALGNVGGSLLLCYFLGGVLLALVLTPITYFAVRGMVMRFRERRLRRKRPEVRP